MAITQHSAAPTRPGFITELHGMRGLALAMVVLFHLFGNGRVSGGVDVFLVISGFLLTGSLYRRLVGGEPVSLDGPVRTNVGAVVTQRACGAVLRRRDDARGPPGVTLGRGVSRDLRVRSLRRELGADPVPACVRRCWAAGQSAPAFLVAVGAGPVLPALAGADDRGSGDNASHRRERADCDHSAGRSC